MENFIFCTVIDRKAKLLLISDYIYFVFHQDIYFLVYYLL